MSQLNVDVIKNKAGTGGPTLQALTVTTNATVTGIVTASSFVGPVTGNVTGNITGNVTGNATGLSGSPNITVSGVNNTGLSTAVEFDITGSTNSLTAGGLTVGVATLTTLNGTSGLVSAGTTFKTKGFVESQTSATNTSNILNLDAANGTVFTHTTTAQIGIVSFSGIRTDTAGTQTFSVLVTQGASPTNTTAATGIGTQRATIVIHPGNVGYTTHIKVGAGSSIILTGTAGALDLLTFIVSYDGTAPSNSAFRVVGFAATDFRNAIV
jgi:hypothetical protein